MKYFFVFLFLTVARLSAQFDPIFDNYANYYTLVINHQLDGVLNPVGRTLMLMQPDMSVTGYWTATGPAITGGNDTGGFGFAFANEKLGVEIEYTLTYKLEFINVDDTNAILVMTYIKTNKTGTTEGGKVQIGRVKRGDPKVSPITNGKGGRDHANSSAFDHVFDYTISYHPIYMSVDYTMGYQGCDGVYYCIGGTIGGWFMGPCEPTYVPGKEQLN